MLLTLIQKEIMHHILSVRFVALLLMCLLLIPLTLHINYRNYLQNQVNYQESLKLSAAETEEKPPDSPAPDMEVSKLFLEPTPLSVFAKGLEESLPSYLGMTRNGVKQGSTSLAEAPLSDCTHRRLYCLGACRIDCTTRGVSYRQTYCTDPRRAECLYGKNCNSQ